MGFRRDLKRSIVRRHLMDKGKVSVYCGYGIAEGRSQTFLTNQRIPVTWTKRPSLLLKWEGNRSQQISLPLLPTDWSLLAYFFRDAYTCRLAAKMSSSAKPEIRNITYRNANSAGPRHGRISTRTNIYLLNFGYLVFEICWQTDMHTCKHTNTTYSQRRYISPCGVVV